MKKFILFALLFVVSASALFAQSTRIAVISDIHFLSSKLAKEGEALTAFERTTGRDVKVLHEVLDKAISEIVEQKAEVLLISGDLTNHGEKQSHLDLAKKLSKLEDEGVKVMVVPGNHDINIPNAKSYNKSKTSNVGSISADEFAKIYYDFGYKHALKRDKSTLSYVAEIDKDTWLLAIDTNLYDEYKTSSISAGRISTSTMQWAMEVLDDARSKGITVIGMMHHGLVEHMPYQSAFFADYLVENWENNAQILADAGLQIVLTGHFHANDITLYTSPLGNNLYDIETGSLAAYPFPYRIMDLRNNTLSIETYKIDKVKSEIDLQAKYRQKSEQIARNAITSRVNSLGMSLPEVVNDVVVGLLTRMSMLHAAGDETISNETYKMIQIFADLMGVEDFDISSFSLDFPPADNKLTIELK